MHGISKCHLVLFLQGRTPFQVPDQVPWPDVAEMLSIKFYQMTGRGLKESNLQYLANKLFNTSGNHDYSNTMVTWSQFNKVGCEKGCLFLYAGL